jgi:hypothetical protein
MPRARNADHVMSPAAYFRMSAKAMLANPDIIGVTQIAHRLGVSPARCKAGLSTPTWNAGFPIWI